MKSPTEFDPSYKDVVEANLTVFNTLAASYNETEPHFSPENKARVQAQLEVVAPLGGTDHMFALRDALNKFGFDHGWVPSIECGDFFKNFCGRTTRQ